MGKVEIQGKESSASLATSSERYSEGEKEEGDMKRRKASRVLSSTAGSGFTGASRQEPHIRGKTRRGQGKQRGKVNILEKIRKGKKTPISLSQDGWMNTCSTLLSHGEMKEEQEEGKDGGIQIKRERGNCNGALSRSIMLMGFRHEYVIHLRKQEKMVIQKQKLILLQEVWS